MPTVWNPNDHRPAHVHVIGAACEVIFNLHCPHSPVELRENYDRSPADLRRIKAELTIA